MATVNLEAAVLDLTVDQGKTVELSFATHVDGEAPDLTDCELRMQVRKSFETPAVINCTLQNGKIAWVDAANGRYRLSLLPSDTAGITPRLFENDTFDGVYDVELIYPTGTVRALHKGAFVIKREVTR